jgi:beta-glucosidase
MHHVLLAHGRAIQSMHALGCTGLGAVMNFEHAAPADASREATDRARTYDAIYNRWFVEAITRGAYPAEALAGLEPHLPAGWENDFATITAPVSWLGINYYTRKLIGPAPGPWPALREVEGPLPKTDMGWEIYPEGLHGFLRRVAATAPGLPIVVTENGMATDVSPEDSARIAYLESHVAAARRAITEGVPLRGYFVWSLLDNYEWALGYEKRFGLVHVDFPTLARTPKASWHALRAALAP